MTASAKTLEDIIKLLTEEILNPFITLLFAVAFAVFIWGVIDMIVKSDSPDGREKGKRHMVWGLVGASIMLGVFAIINTITGIFK
ncbi:MAG: hypothetical protein A3F26_01355 [Candidatus Ryanbacteria bacterium RIFCSPHIGHO2_12_FULL_47_12b]|uniref:Uncharacterized protein n=3 Tax=Parcubacteria group TaxID=1794811 RepID=A0A1G2H2N3_9BACT|nr:MAG: hypothetical protein UY02_C0050G0004 [Candidatus Giovannonibacteria bacterium GW2011_GWB1_47_6b]KKU84941.1 MAG: hypothetical protein UY14_C0039G0006 [Parcubacteria group bacterium GW2011_GWA1_47_9]OGZ52367.1 MAG: hypothetical protein A3F26_01355 [Candidatus Ryanbacteria bacterium RIFCSPHIGHO2_12_FULL_47_12b]OGZ56147.1 MAG: hypothetical protein A3J04_00300 [Candidatus Ryanbacteria bacterium RIFCSPLOWO2_02_FULL_47_14]OGZ56570.1 MAG: hypothetical protein A3G60_01000 [Candidatus Ryanbacteri